MNEIELRLKGLQPDPGTLDRDGLLYHAAFAAGRRSARPVIPWRAVCGVLIVAQVGTLALLDRYRSPKPLALPAVEETRPADRIELPTTVSPEPNSYIALMRHLGEAMPPGTYPEASPPDAPLTPHSAIE